MLMMKRSLALCTLSIATLGLSPALFAATVEVLAQLGWLDDAQREALAPWRAQDILSIRGVKVGERLPVFRLQTPA